MNYIVDDIGEVVKGMRLDDELISAFGQLSELNNTGYQVGMPYYMYGHRQEISNRLLAKDKDKVYKYQKYPLVALRLDIPEDNVDGMIEFTINVALIMQTDKNWHAPERYRKVFKPILYPMYKSFLSQLKQSGLFTWEGDRRRPKHTKLDRPYWGITGNEGNTANIFNDPLDAIELIDLKVKQEIKCYKARLFAEQFAEEYE